MTFEAWHNLPYTVRKSKKRLYEYMVETIEEELDELRDYHNKVNVTASCGNALVSGAVVTLTDKNNTSNTYKATTGSDGKCVIKNVPDGLYSVAATCTGYNNYTGEDLTVDGNENLSIELVRITYNISVSVADSESAAIEGATVVFTDTTSSETYTKTSGSAGGCTVVAPAGTYNVTATKEGYTDYASSEPVTISANASYSITMTAAASE